MPTINQLVRQAEEWLRSQVPSLGNMNNLTHSTDKFASKEGVCVAKLRL